MDSMTFFSIALLKDKVRAVKKANTNGKLQISNKQHFHSNIKECEP